ncbi:hypothetical protein yc1106_04125 [Curvularia clavata]|uniref:Aminoglycoside phosphotransferase domain-containing protein n=1 Tax=Curvularia clavata TaxID=95742 RepID=A0A9Q9DSW7_CURCL|nr:hypothetical protein yc1106_04125 [Curvularia clavata]
MAPIGRFQVSNLAQLQEALQNLPANLRSNPQSSELQPPASLDFFDDDRIFTPDGGYHPDGENIDFREKVFQLLSSLFPPDGSQHPSIRLLGKGSYNIVVGVDVVPKSRRGDGSKPSAEISRLFGTPPKPRTFALRIPVADSGFNDPLPSYSMDDIYQDIANLYVVGQRLDLPVPRILKHDLKGYNALDRPFTLQNFIGGTQLERSWAELNLKQKVSAIQAITQIVEKIASVTAPAAGQIAYSNVTSPGKDIKVNEFLIPTKYQAQRSDLPGPCEAMEQTPHEFLMSCCKRWIEYENKNMPGFSMSTPLWSKIKEIITILEEKGWLGGSFHLVHGDFFGRNILVEIASDTAVKVTGVVDWDMARFAPKFVAFRGPFWAWNPELEEEKEDAANTGAISREEKAIKEAFLETASPEYATMALAEEAIIARKIFKIATFGLLAVELRGLAFELIKQWEELHPRLTKQYVAL